MVQHLESHRGTTSTIEALAHCFGIKRRGLCNFLIVCTAFGICRRYSSTKIEWLGIDRSEGVVNSIRERCREDDGQLALHDVFRLSADPSLQRLAVSIIKLFFLLRVKFLDLRKVGRLFANGTTKYKTMLRKLYTAATGLELAGLVRKTKMVAEIQLVIPFHGEQRHRELGLECILNTEEELQEERTCARRQQEFEALWTGSLVSYRQ
jgi:hypothetical protein